jgi:hypothetical protein
MHCIPFFVLAANWRIMAMSYTDYLRQLVAVTFSTSLALGLVLAILIISSGGFTAGIDLTLEFAQMDGLWLIPGAPLLLLSCCLLVSPLSYLLDKQLVRRQPRRE